ncbi:DEAD/DEAH box helicase family protein [Pedobacter sp. MC2016-15]|jgi:hypothetical protein|uniref:DEAD/DEAH box helicase family protein n=1 Tax=Pedobacter sp. MC2016-15 TaxID=2994473 RepID=UPI002247C004|nr:DEAD/DEAH box helicase family protein [Pedobacter sp. MC2016-15]MCX2481045.1 DEAD/DEAH box helicase family protein [Pedobacter sp. MC2016-15]
MKTPIDYSRYLTFTERTELQTTYNFRLKVKHRLNKAFLIIPNNAIINKGRCGIGGTYLEIKAKRNSIIIVPTNAIIDNKCYKNGELLPNYRAVRGSLSEKAEAELTEFIDSDLVGKKIFCTPESLSKVIKCSKSKSSTYNTWFILFDEAHTAITDSYRTHILDAFEFFFRFKHKALISATPFNFSSEDFKGFDIYNIKFRGHVGRMRVENTNDPQALLHSKLINPQAFPGRVHIFLNSVKGIVDTITRASLKPEDFSVFCTKDKGNIETLDDLRSNHREAPMEDTYRKFNFYTTKYFEGWDLYDFKATIIILSDINSYTLKSGISNKCVQAAGRNRYYSNQIIHITNSRSKASRTPIEELQSLIKSTGQDAINDFNNHSNKVFTGLTYYDVDYHTLVKKYSDFDDIGIAFLNTFKVDQIANLEWTDQEYNHISIIEDAWTEAGYKCSSVNDYIPRLPKNFEQLSKANRIKKVVEYLRASDASTFDVLVLNNFRNNLPLLVQPICDAYMEIGGDKMEELRYNEKLIGQEVIMSINERNVVLIKAEYYARMGNRDVLKTDIAEYLRSLYVKYKRLNPKTGDYFTAYATDLMTVFQFDTKLVRIGTVNGLRIIKY